MTAPDVSPSLAFADLVRSAGRSARELGLAVPGYRSPPHHPTADRTYKPDPSGLSAGRVSVRVKGRPLIDVALDVVAGIAAANDIGEGHRDITRIRTRVLDEHGLGGQRRTA